jgi:hypothetical protein
VWEREYRQLAMLVHPDHSDVEGTVECFKKLSCAHDYILQGVHSINNIQWN